MDRIISASVDASPEATMKALADLATYPNWLALVTTATPEDDETWIVTIRARLGRLARSKRLRMARTHRDDAMVRFERREVDGRTHAEWTLEAAVSPTGPETCDVKVTLHYGGALWSAPLELVLSSFEGTAAEQLSAFLADDAAR